MFSSVKPLDARSKSTLYTPLYRLTDHFTVAEPQNRSNDELQNCGSTDFDPSINFKGSCTNTKMIVLCAHICFNLPLVILGYDSLKISVQFWS